MQSSLPQFTFKWPQGPETVILTGTFDEWKGTLPMVKDPSGAFEITLPVKIDGSDDKLYFKFIVDGQWSLNKDYRVAVDRGAENNFITKEDITKQYGNNTSMLIPESGGLAVSNNTTLTEAKEEKPGKLKKFKIKRVIKTNKQTGERSIFSQQVIELSDSDDEMQKVNQKGKNVDDLSGTTTIIENNDGGVNEENAVKPYEDTHLKIGLVKNEESVANDLGKTQSSADSRLYELSAEELEEEEEEEEEEEDKNEDGDEDEDDTEAEVAKVQNEKSLKEVTKSGNSEKEVKVPIGTAKAAVEEVPGKAVGEVTVEAQTFKEKQNPPTITAKEVEIKRTTRTAKPTGTKKSPHTEVQGSHVKKGGFFKKLSQLLK